jgi:CRISPR-associated exonuclease Cas4
VSPLAVLPSADSDTYPPLSALNDLLFCERRCYFHRVEGVWADNAHTAAGTVAHRRAHQPAEADGAAGRTARGLWLVSHRLRLVGVADVVEFCPDPTGGPDVPFPVEYKRGRRRRWDNDEVQLCAQAVCLEEMTGAAVPAGAVFNVKSRRRREVGFTLDLRRRTEQAAARLHALLVERAAPAPVLHPKCRGCSVRDHCLPDLLAAGPGYRRALGQLFARPAHGV